jgi:hypothetical protein
MYLYGDVLSMATPPPTLWLIDCSQLPDERHALSCASRPTHSMSCHVIPRLALRCAHTVHDQHIDTSMYWLAYPTLPYPILPTVPYHIIPYHTILGCTDAW